MYVLNIYLMPYYTRERLPTHLEFVYFLFLYVPMLNDFRSKQHVKFSGETAETRPNNKYI